MKCLIHALALTFGLLSTAWAQSAKPMSLEQLAAYDKPDREQILYAGAKPMSQQLLGRLLRRQHFSRRRRASFQFGNPKHSRRLFPH